MGKPTPPTRTERQVRAAVLTLFAVLGIVYSVTVPIFEISDELWHYPMVEVIARTWRLPVQPLEPGASSGPWRQEGSQPPLYYALGAALTFWIDTSDMDITRQPNPHARAGEITPERDNVNLVIHNPSVERFPWSGTVLAVHLVRLLSVALGTWAVALTWSLARELWPDQRWVAPAAAAVHAFTPMVLFISSSVNNDNLIVPLSTLSLLLMVRQVKSAGRPPERTGVSAYVMLGCVIGLALLTKASGIALLILAGAALAWEAWRLPDASLARRTGAVAMRATAILVPAALISGWWFARNVRLYDDWLGFNAFYAVLGTRDVPANLAQLWAERFAFATGYWGSFGGLNVPMPTWTYTVLNAVAIVAAGGLAVRFIAWLLRKSDGSLRQKLWPLAWTNTTAAHALGWAFPAGVFVSWMRWATVTWSSQGRLIFTAIAVLSPALVLGLSAWAPRRKGACGEVPGAILGLGLLALCVAALPAWIIPAYAPPQPVVASPEALGLRPLTVRFGDALELLGYEVESEVAEPGGAVALRLLWRAVGPTQTYRSLFIHLLGQGERIVAQRDTFPGHGLLPTTQLIPGHSWEERHILPIPAVAYTPDVLTLAVGVYETSTGARLAAAGSSSGGDDTTRFGSIALTSIESTTFAVHFGEGIVLTAYDLSSVTVAPGDAVTVTFDWLCAEPISDDYTISVQLLDEHWRKASQSDAWPLDGKAPTSSWQTGQQLTETRVLTIASDAEPGAYDLLLSIYRPGAEGSLVHLPVSLGDAGMPTKSIVLTRVRVQ
ncbi:MAG: glycosyltransferase family 39 protein [Anaerolineae bacterium]|jgi:hypothetical protein|nr:glycosyltransferase family 39 protein [Anaerolineae bacterium]